MPINKEIDKICPLSLILFNFYISKVFRIWKLKMDFRMECSLDWRGHFIVSTGIVIIQISQEKVAKSRIYI